MLSIETANFFFAFSIYLFINITYRLCIYRIYSFYIMRTLQISCVCMRIFNNFYHGSVSICKHDKMSKNTKIREVVLFVHSTKEKGNSNRIVCRNFRRSFKFSKGNVGRQ